MGMGTRLPPQLSEASFSSWLGHGTSYSSLPAGLQLAVSFPALASPAPSCSPAAPGLLPWLWVRQAGGTDVPSLSGEKAAALLQASQPGRRK